MMNTCGPEPHTWKFPLERTHTGILLGNGLMGVMVWGEGCVLKLTVGRADFWDHRGGSSWTPEQNYENIRSCLEARDDERIRRLFEQAEYKEGEPKRPSIMPFGRIELHFPDSCTITQGTLDMRGGKIRIDMSANNEIYKLLITLDMLQPVLQIHGLPSDLQPHMDVTTSWDLIGDYLSSISIEQPVRFNEAEMAGWVQPMPADLSTCLAYSRNNDGFLVVTSRGSSVQAAKEQASKLLREATAQGSDEINQRVEDWWEQYWRSSPVIHIPNDKLQFLHDYGMYKFAGLTNPAGVAAGLQGPWIEEYQMPPWSGDYHFNINVQMCYWPAYRGNKLEHLKPLWALIKSWEDQLRLHAKMFIGVEDGYMLPHAVDDQCRVVGAFWTGIIDHGCTAWVAQLMFKYYQYTGDLEFLKDTAYPFMKGTMRVYEKMLEFDNDREQYVLAVSVSPEYKGSRIEAWGRNASFQLAAIHRLLDDISHASRILGEELESGWIDIKARLPLAAIDLDNERPRMLIWDGQSLDESHRHHSHLAGIYPFDIFDRSDPNWEKIIHTTIDEWVYRGTGMWAGWSMPWASILYTCLGHSSMAEHMLETFDRIFTNEGHGTIYDSVHPGFSLVHLHTPYSHEKLERMQMDGGMASVAAVQEMLLCTMQGINYLFRGVPMSWEDVSFTGLRTEGCYRVSAWKQNGKVTKVIVESEQAGEFALQNPWQGSVRLVCSHSLQEPYAQVAPYDSVLRFSTKPGEVWELSSVKR